MKKVRHVLGISGGKDSAALAIYMKDKYPQMKIEYYTCDTGKELDETYQLIKNLEIYLGKKIVQLQATDGHNENPFDHFLKLYGGYLPSSNSRWCTKKLKLEPFEKFVGDDPVISYVGIRGDEDREGYISRRSNIQSIFPFRQNIWSEDVIIKTLSNNNSNQILSLFKSMDHIAYSDKFEQILAKAVSQSYTANQKLNQLLETNVTLFNSLVFKFLKTSEYPLAQEEIFPLLENEDVLGRDDIFNILEKSGVGVPKYYKKVDFAVNGNEGQYARSRSGCYFCFFQQKIEWVWLYEQHPERFAKAMEYEKDGYTWCQDESLLELIQPERMQRIKEDFIKKQGKVGITKKDWKDIVLEDAEGEGCAACFI